MHKKPCDESEPRTRLGFYALRSFGKLRRCLRASITGKECLAPGKAHRCALLKDRCPHRLTCCQSTFASLGPAQTLPLARVLPLAFAVCELERRCAGFGVGFDRDRRQFFRNFRHCWYPFLFCWYRQSSDIPTNLPTTLPGCHGTSLYHFGRTAIKKPAVMRVSGLTWTCSNV